MESEKTETTDEETPTIGNWPVDLVGGEIRAIHREENLCGGCLNFPICKVADKIDEEMMLVVSRCLSFLDAEILAG